MGGGLESRCVGRVYGADGTARHLVLLMTGVCARNMSSEGYINKLHCCIKLTFHIVAR